MTHTQKIAAFAPAVQERTKKPARRGAFRPIDAARRQLGLLTAGDSTGQARAYWLIDMDSQTVADARFLAFGELSSHAIADAYTDLVREKPVEEALQVGASAVQAALGAQPFGTFDSDDLYGFIAPLTENLRAELPHVKLLPKPEEKPRYVRKREQDWTDEDKAWIPLSLLKKIGKAQKVLSVAVKKHFGTSDVSVSVEGLHDDFRIVVKIDGLQDDQKPMVVQFMSEAAHQELHGSCQVVAEEAE